MEGPVLSAVYNLDMRTSEAKHLSFEHAENACKTLKGYILHKYVEQFLLMAVMVCL